MPLVRFVRGVVWAGEPRGTGDTLEVSDKDAFILCDGYKDAVRVDGKVMAATGGMTTSGATVQTRDPVAEHRDPVTRPQQRRR